MIGKAVEAPGKIAMIASPGAASAADLLLHDGLKQAKSSRRRRAAAAQRRRLLRRDGRTGAAAGTPGTRIN